jgi:hypothetical protein
MSTSTLPTGWRRMTEAKLYVILASLDGDSPEADRVWAEIERREDSESPHPESPSLADTSDMPSYAS